MADGWSEGWPRSVAGAYNSLNSPARRAEIVVPLSEAVSKSELQPILRLINDCRVLGQSGDLREARNRLTALLSTDSED